MMIKMIGKMYGFNMIPGVTTLFERLVAQGTFELILSFLLHIGVKVLIRGNF